MLLCGTDFSPAAKTALLAAAALARKQDDSLLLVHVLEHESTASRAKATAELAQEAAELQRSFAGSIDTAIVSGIPAQRLLDLVHEKKARLLVVGLSGGGPGSHPPGRVSEHLAQKSDVPVLVVRNAEPLLSWSHGKAALRALVGSGLGDASRSALACVGNWPDVAITVAYIAWPYGAHYRLGVKAPVPRDELVPEVRDHLLGDLGRWALDIPCRVTPKLSVLAGWNRIDFHMKGLIERSEADLLVIGIHQRNASDDVWQSSISRSLLQEATCNVLCVPERFLPVQTSPVPRLVVVPTDFSTLSDRAIGVACSVLGLGGVLHLLNVTSDRRDTAQAQALTQLKARVPSGAATRRISVELRVLQADDPWLAIWQHAERARADLICMAAHSRHAGPDLVLGSQTRAVMQHAQVPVVVVPPDRET